MRRIGLVLSALLFAVLGSGCSLMAPQYSASIQNVQTLKNSGDFSAKVSKFGADKNISNNISLRGSSLQSPYDGSYADYLTEAIKQELSLAGKLSTGADVDVSGVLLKNDMDASGFSVATGDIEARFVVKKSGIVKYDKVQHAHTQWDSSFVGAVAIPAAQNEYPHLVQELLKTLYSDQDFIQALK